MAYRAHKRPDGKASKGSNGRPITSHADCCGCGGGNPDDPISPCTCFPITFTSDGRQCGIPDGSIPGVTGFFETTVSITYSERRTSVSTGEVLSDVPSQTRTASLSTPLVGGCTSFARDDQLPAPIRFSQNVPGAQEPIFRFFDTMSNDATPGVSWSVNTNRRSLWAATGNPSVAPLNRPTMFIGGDGFAAPSSRGLRVESGIDTPVICDLFARWDRAGSAFYGQAVFFGSRGPDIPNGISGNASVSLSLTRANCILDLNYSSSGSGTRANGGDIYVVQYSVQLQHRIRLGRCGTPPGGLLMGDGSTFVDPAVDAVFREYGKCRGCGDGNPMA